MKQRRISAENHRSYDNNVAKRRRVFCRRSGDDHRMSSVCISHLLTPPGLPSIRYRPWVDFRYVLLVRFVFVRSVTDGYLSQFSVEEREHRFGYYCTVPVVYPMPISPSPIRCCLNNWTGFCVYEAIIFRVRRAFRGRFLDGFSSWGCSI